MIAIKREERYSPGAVEADAAILAAVATRLRAAGHEVVVLRADEFLRAFPADNPAYDPAMEALLGRAAAVLTMSRDPETVAMLDIVERCYHVPCINSGRGVNICSCRPLLDGHLREAGLLTPPSWAGSLYGEDVRCPGDPPDACTLLAELPYPVWVKRGYGYTRVSQDVTFAADAAAARQALRGFRERGCDEVVFCRHIEGTHVKFYGVGERWFYVAPTERPLDTETLRRGCEAVAARLGVPVYGGDAIVAPDGTATVIDFNDWPSFRPCREQAAQAIAELSVEGRK